MHKSRTNGDDPFFLRSCEGTSVKEVNRNISERVSESRLDSVVPESFHREREIVPPDGERSKSRENDMFGICSSSTAAKGKIGC